MDYLKYLNKYFFSNVILSITSLLFSVGGVILIIYFTSVGYFPIFDFKSLAMVLIAIALVTLVLVLTIIVMNSLPAYIWYEVFGKNVQLKELWICNKKISFGILPYFCLLPIIFFIGLAIHILVISHLTNRWILMISFMVEIVLFSIYLFYLYKLFNILKEQVSELASCEAIKYIIFELCKFGCASIASSILFTLPLYVFLLIFVVNGIGIGDELKLLGLVVFIVCIIVINVLHILVLETTTGKQQVAIMSMMGMFVLYVMVTSSGNVNLIPANIMKQYKFGNFNFEKLVINKTGCQIIKTYDIHHTESNDVCVIEDGKIISRLGDEVLFEFMSKKGNNQLRFTLPSSAVLSLYSEIDRVKTQ